MLLSDVMVKQSHTTQRGQKQRNISPCDMIPFSWSCGWPIFFQQFDGQKFTSQLPKPNQPYTLYSKGWMGWTCLVISQTNHTWYSCLPKRKCQNFIPPGHISVEVGNQLIFLMTQSTAVVRNASPEVLTNFLSDRFWHVETVLGPWLDYVNNKNHVKTAGYTSSLWHTMTHMKLIWQIRSRILCQVLVEKQVNSQLTVKLSIGNHWLYCDLFYLRFCKIRSLKCSLCHFKLKTP